MAWTDADLKILAAGMAIGAKWNHVKTTTSQTGDLADRGLSFSNNYYFFNWLVPPMIIEIEVGTAEGV